MSYAIGIDLGTTYTAAATWRDGHAEIASLGSRAAVIPSVVLLRADETVLTGESAHRRGLSEPNRVSREFKRRLGDTTPILLGGVPYSAEALMARLLRSVVDDVAEREGGPAERVCISHPANWGPYKKDLLTQAVRLSGIEQPVTYTTEPEAAAVFYAYQQRVEPGAVVAVYDLGGGTFDAAVLRKTATGFEILGQPEGIERLGGIDFDAAVFNHVRQALGGKLDELDEDDPAAIAAVARLREECVAAKEALSSDTDASIPVLLPNISTEIRLTRGELEAMIRPILHTTIEALRRALRTAQVEAEALHSVLLVGGSSRIPLVSQLVGAELGRPVAVDAHPKHAIALGAAWLASGASTLGTDPAATSPAGAGAGAGAAAAAAAAAGIASARPAAAGPAPSATGPSTAQQPTYAGSAAVPGAPTTPATPTAPTMPAAPPPPPPSTADTMRAPVPPPAGVTGSASVRLPSAAGVQPGQYGSAAGTPPGEPPSAPGGSAEGSRRRLLLVGVIALALVLVSGGAVAWAMSGRDADNPAENPLADEEPELAATGAPTDSPDNQPTEPPDQETVPPDEQCTDDIRSNPHWVCLTSAVWEGGNLVLHYDANFGGEQPTINGGFHLHIWGSDGSYPPADIMGTQVSGGEQGSWKIRDEKPAVLSASDVAEVVGDLPKVCARIADGHHALVTDGHGGYTTGNCVPVPPR